MAWYRCGGGGLPAGLQSDMDAVLNKKFSTSTTYPPTDWADTVNLMGPLPEKTASGAVANLTDGADEVPIKSWQVSLPASLTGYSSVTAYKAKKNLADGNMTQDGANRVILADNIFLKSGTYTISLEAETARNFYYREHGQSAWANIGGYNKKVVTFTISADGNYDFSYYISSGVTVDEISNLQIEVGSTATSYEAYEAPTQYTASLGRTIYGGTADIVTGEGEDENGNAFTFTPITPAPETALGVNNFWADEGESAVTYRKDLDIPGPVPGNLLGMNNGNNEENEEESEG